MLWSWKKPSFNNTPSISAEVLLPAAPILHFFAFFCGLNPEQTPGIFFFGVEIPPGFGVLHDQSSCKVGLLGFFFSLWGLSIIPKFWGGNLGGKEWSQESSEHFWLGTIPKVGGKGKFCIFNSMYAEKNDPKCEFCNCCKSLNTNPSPCLSGIPKIHKKSGNWGRKKWSWGVLPSREHK